MGNRHNGAFKVMQEALQPGDGFGVQVVGRFVEQQHVRFFEQQAAERHAAAFTTGEIRDFRIPVRQTQGVGRAFQLHVQVVAVMGLDNFFQFALLGGELIEIGIRVCVQRVHFIQALERVNDFRDRFFDRFAHGMFRVELRLLRQVADFDARLRTGFTFDIFIDARHDAQQGGFTGAVQAQHTDFGAREKAQRDILQNVSLRRNDFADAMHGVYELSHVGLRLLS